LKVGQISTQYDEIHGPSIKLGDALDSVSNSSRDFAEASQCVNNPNFEIGSLFTEVQNNGVSRCGLNNRQRDNDEDIRIIPFLSKAMITFGGKNVDSIVRLYIQLQNCSRDLTMHTSGYAARLILNRRETLILSRQV